MKSGLAARRGGHQRGNALLEFALGITLLVFLLIGVIDYGPIFYNTIELDAGARAGAIFGSQSVAHSADLAGMRQIALDNIVNLTGVAATAQQICQCPGISATVDCASTCANGASLVVYAKVTTTWTYQPSFEFPTVAYPLTFARTAQMRAQ